MNNFLLEGCVDSLASARIAIRAGADRLELCANLSIGGTTPSHALFRQVKAAWDGPVNVLIRPRFGDFLYSPGELEEMAEEIAQFRAQGADGIVVGVLTPQGDLDRAAMEALMAAAGGLPVTLHRAFDMTADPFAALEDAVKLGCATILTSGQAPSAPAGAELLRELHTRAGDRLTILAGAGVKSSNIPALYAQTGVTAYHTSGRAGAVDSGMVYRKPGVSMGLPSLSEYELWRTDEAEMAACAQAVHSLEVGA